MPPTSHSPDKPENSVRTIPVSLALLALAVILAGAMSHARSGDLLGARVQPGGWTVSFRPPRRFQSQQFGAAPLDLPYIAHGRTRFGDKAILAVYRLDATGFADPTAVCESVIRSNSDLQSGDWLTGRRLRSDRRIGGNPAVEIALREMGIVARAVLLPSGEAYAVWLGVEGAPLDDNTYRLFDLTCLSFEGEFTP